MTRRVAFTNEAFGDWTVNGQATWNPNVQGAYLALRNSKNPGQDSYRRYPKVAWKQTQPNFAEVIVTLDDSNVVKCAGFFQYYSTTVDGILIETELMENPTVTALKINGMDVKPVDVPVG